MYEITQVDIDRKKFKQHESTHELATKYIDDLKERMNKDIGCFGVEMEARKQVIRTSETNFPNMLADLFRTEMNADFGIVNMGGIRLNEVMPVGNFTHL